MGENNHVKTLNYLNELALNIKVINTLKTVINNTLNILIYMHDLTNYFIDQLGDRKYKDLIREICIVLIKVYQKYNFFPIILDDKLIITCSIK